MKAALSEAAFKAAPFTVLGRKLKPFTIWHQILLENLDSCFAVGSKKPTSLEDLIISTYFCSFDYAGGLEQIQSSLLKIRVSLWGWSCKRHDYDPLEEIDRFYSYIDSSSNCPDYWFNSQATDSGKVNSIGQSLKIRMIQGFGVSEVQALNTPYQTALVNHLLLLESNGVISFVNDDDADLIEKAKQMDAKLQEFAKRIKNNG